MTETEALPTIYIVIVATPVIVLFWLGYRFIARAQMKADYYPDHWYEDSP